MLNSLFTRHLFLMMRPHVRNESGMQSRQAMMKVKEMLAAARRDEDARLAGREIEKRRSAAVAPPQAYLTR